MIIKPCAAAVLAVALAGCSGIKFSNRDDGRSHPYRVAFPALKVVTDSDCKMTAEVVSIPGAKNYLSFQSGLGKSDSTVIFEPGGTIKQIHSKQEGVTDDLVKLLGVAKGAGVFGVAREDDEVTVAGPCQPSVAIYPISFDETTQQASVNTARPLLKIDATLAQ